MSWLDEMKRDAVALVDPDLVLTDDLEVTVDMNYDDGYDPTYGDHMPTYSFEIQVWTKVVPRRCLVSVSYSGLEAQEFWLDLMKAAAK